MCASAGFFTNQKQCLTNPMCKRSGVFCTGWSELECVILDRTCSRVSVDQKSHRITVTRGWGGIPPYRLTGLLWILTDPNTYLTDSSGRCNDEVDDEALAELQAFLLDGGTAKKLINGIYEYGYVKPSNIQALSLTPKFRGFWARTPKKLMCLVRGARDLVQAFVKVKISGFGHCETHQITKGTPQEAPKAELVCMLIWFM